MIKQLSHVLNKIQEMSNMKLMNHLQVEFHAISKSEIKLEMFKSKKDINELNISVLTKYVQKTTFEF